MMSDFKFYESNPEFLAFSKYSGIDEKSEKKLSYNFLRDQISEEKKSFQKEESKAINTQQDKNHLIDRQIEQDKVFCRLIGQSEKTKLLKRDIFCIKDKRCKVLISGESGTGKSLLAHVIHESSPVKNSQFVSVNVGALQKDLIESTLFGSVKGAFTDAVDRKGLMSLADGGTLFLDEISELPFSCQAKLLRAIDEGIYRKVGSDKEEKVNCRFICATNQNLKDLIKKKLFREDLYYRIAEFCINVVPLRERKEDILILAEHFLYEANLKSNLDKKYFSTEAKEKLLQYDWPGNIRELRTAVNVSIIYSQQTKILPCDIQFI